MTKIDDALVARMEALVRFIASTGVHDPKASPFVWHREARAIVAELPAPVDPLMAEAREIALAYSVPAILRGISSYHVKQGGEDDQPYMQAILAGLRRARDGGEV